MKQGLLASLTCLLVAACASGPIPTTSPAPSSTAGASPSPSAPAPSTQAPTASPKPTGLGGPTPHPIEKAWSERVDVAAGPAAREDHTWTIDADGGTAYLFGGRTADGPQADLWAFDLETDVWTELQPTGPGPQARFGHTATWVPDVGLVVWSGQGRDFFSDLWAYDPLVDAWNELPSLGDVPLARYGSCAALGPDGRLWISHGFTQDDGRFADTRAYDFATGEWTNMTPPGDAPVKRCLHDCFWSDDARLILYGGQTTNVAALGDVWAYATEEGAWHQGPVSAAPPRQLYAVAPLATDAALLFGGGSLERGYLDDAWALDMATLAMSPRQYGGATPPARSGAALIADMARPRSLLFGGLNADGLLGDLWELAPPTP